MNNQIISKYFNENNKPNSNNTFTQKLNVRQSDTLQIRHTANQTHCHLSLYKK